MMVESGVGVRIRKKKEHTQGTALLLGTGNKVVL